MKIILILVCRRMFFCVRVSSAMVVGFLFARETMAEVPKAAKSFSQPQAFRATDEQPLIRKLGTIDLDMVETTPAVLRGKIWRFEWVRQGTGQQYWNNLRHTNYFRFLKPETDAVTPPFADGHEFGSAFVDGGTVYVTGTQGRSRVNLFVSRDLTNWVRTVINDPCYGIFNSSI